MPVLFVGHGSPMNIVEENPFTQGWEKIAEAIPKPKAILCVSAHWFTEQDALSEAEHPDTIHDFYGFPEELYEIQYPAPGSPDLARKTANLLPSARLDRNRGLDHGAWSVLHFMFPNADIPVVQLTVNRNNTPLESYQKGEALRPLREQGVLIIGSGNVVHNLGLVGWDMNAGYGWADEFDAYIKSAVQEGRHEDTIHYKNAGASANRAFVIRDHYDPLLYALGAAGHESSALVFNDARTLGSISMTSYCLS